MLEFPTKMLALRCRRLYQLRWAGHSSPHLCILQTSSLRFNSNTTNEPSATVDYLVNSCGLSPESALKASKCIGLKIAAKPDSVLALFKNYGFTQSQISNVISHNPSVLRLDPDKNLKPKIELLCNMGISGPNLAKILSRYTTFLMASLERELIPTLDFLKSFVHTDEKIAVTLSRLGWGCRLPEIMAPNIEILRNHGVPDSIISKLIVGQPRLLTWKAERFKEIVLRVKEMGLDPTSSTFVSGVLVLAGCRKTVGAKLGVFRSFGWLEDDILSLFRKNPILFGFSEKRIRVGVDFFMKKLKWTITDIMNCPFALNYSMEKRTVPRGSVLRVLIKKGLIKKESMGTAFVLTEGKFLDRFVLKYQDEQPQLLKLYRCQMGILESEVASDKVMRG